MFLRGVSCLIFLRYFICLIIKGRDLRLSGKSWKRRVLFRQNRSGYLIYIFVVHHI